MSQYSDILVVVRARLIEPVQKFWLDSELMEYMDKGTRDLWRDIVDLKQDHFLKIDNTSMVLPPNTFHVSGVPQDLHKVFNIEPTDLTVNSSNKGLLFIPTPYNDRDFQFARSEDAINPQNDAIYYSVHLAGAPVSSPDIVCAPQVTSAVPLSVAYVPTLGPLGLGDINPIPGESDNAIIAWTLAYARAKESESRSPDPAWLTVYATEKAHLLQSLGIRQYQELPLARAYFQEYW